MTVGGAGPEQAAGQVQFFREEFDLQMEAFVKAHESAMGRAAMVGAALFEQTRTPTERYRKQIEDINQLMAGGFLGVGPAAENTAERARRAAQEELLQSEGQERGQPQGPQFAAAQLRGSAQAFSTIVQAGARDKIPRQQLKVGKEQLAELKGISRKLEAQETVSIPAG